MPERAVVRDRVWWRDVDKMNVMHFGQYLRLMEMAETEFFRAHGFTYDAISEECGIWLARVHVEVDYRAPARLDDELECWAELTKTGGSTLHFAFPIERNGERLADGVFVLSCLDRTTMRSTRVPALLRERFDA